MGWRVVVAVIPIFFAWGCSPSLDGNPSSLREWAQKNGKVKVLCTTQMIQDLVVQVGGERIDSLPLVVGDMDPHSYELVKGDDEKFHLAQLVFYNGLSLEHGASLHYRLHSHPGSINLGRWLQEKFPQKIILEEGEVDPHVWMDISLWALTIDPIVSALCKIDPEGTPFYEARACSLRETMEKSHLAVRSLLQSVPKEKRYIVTSHDAFNYFTRAYLATEEEELNGTWRSRFEAPEGLAPEGQLSSADIQDVVTHLIQYQIHVVFPESNVSRDSLKKVVHVCKEKGFTVALWPNVLYGDAVGPKGSIASTYLGMILYDAMQLTSAWKGEEK